MYDWDSDSDIQQNVENIPWANEKRIIAIEVEMEVAEFFSVGPDPLPSFLSRSPKLNWFMILFEHQIDSRSFMKQL